jgi:hypothetical protein
LGFFACEDCGMIIIGIELEKYQREDFEMIKSWNSLKEAHTFPICSGFFDNIFYEPNNCPMKNRYDYVILTKVLWRFMNDV